MIMISDPMTIANKFNEYFAHISSTLVDKITAAPHFNNYFINPVETKFSFQTITKNKVSNIINKLKNKISYGYHSISNMMLKEAHGLLIRPLTLLINQTLSTDIFPNPLKKLQIKPLFKQGNEHQFRFRAGNSTELASLKFVQKMNNFYVPISIFINLSKAFDTLDHDIMLSKLRYYCVSGIEFNCLLSFRKVSVC